MGMTTETGLWTYREPVQGLDLTGFEVEAIDGGIGKVDEASYEVGGSYIVVDTGPWIFGKKVMLPAWTVERIDLEDRKLYVDRTKEEIKNGPEFNRDLYREPTYRDELGAYYADYYAR
jgi:hypothetical protein